LQAGALKVVDLKREARAAGIAERTLERAKQHLCIQAKREGGAAGNGWWTWSLPEPNKPANASSASSDGGVSKNSLPQATVPNAAANGSPLSDGGLGERVEADRRRAASPWAWPSEQADAAAQRALGLTPEPPCANGDPLA
jgi:hypothetical protein